MVDGGWMVGGWWTDGGRMVGGGLVDGGWMVGGWWWRMEASASELEMRVSRERRVEVLILTSGAQRGRQRPPFDRTFSLDVLACRGVYDLLPRRVLVHAVTVAALGPAVVAGAYRTQAQEVALH